MVNLLPRTPSPARAGLRVEAASLRRIGERLGPLLALHRHRRLTALEPAFEVLAPELEELASAPSRVAALALLEAIDALRVGAARSLASGSEERAARPGPAPGPPGASVAHRDAGSIAFVCHRPGRSLATGEAEIASRGYFDVEDRPPLAAWLELLPLPPSKGEGEADFAIVAWVAGEDRARARAGCRACGSGALEWLDDFAPDAAAQLRAGVVRPASATVD